MSDLLWGRGDSATSVKSQSNLHLSFSQTTSGKCLHQASHTEKPFIFMRCQCIRDATLLCLFLYALCTKNEQELRRWSTVSSDEPHKWQFGVVVNLYILDLMTLVDKACSCAAKINPSISFVNLPNFNQDH